MTGTDTANETKNNNLSLRTIIEGLILMGIGWMAFSITNLTIAITKVQTQMTNVQTTLAAVPNLQREATTLGVVQVEHERRLAALELLESKK